MITREQFKVLSQPFMEGKAYYRPFICKGDHSNAKVFLVGINPATPIYSNDIDIDSYVDLCLNYDAFIKFYTQKRTEMGKTGVSRTRMGINSFISWLEEQLQTTVLETNVIAYPTKNLKELNSEPEEIINRGRDVFKTLLEAYAPNLIIMHGKEGLRHFEKLVCEATSSFKKLTFFDDNYSKLSAEQLENNSPVAVLEYASGKQAKIMFCRHFMYYGKEGNSFNNIKEIIAKEMG